MLIGFSYLCVSYVLCLFFQIAENDRLKKANWPNFFNIIFWFLLNVGSIGPVNQQINFVSSSVFPLKFV